MSDKTAFSPDWISPPGETIATLLHERGLRSEEFARKIDRTTREVEELLQGRVAITSDLAKLLSVALGASSSFWTNRESRYRNELARLTQEAARAVDTNWLKEVPVKDLIASGMVRPARDKVSLAVSVLQFFGVSSVDAWRSSYHESLNPVAFRTSSTFKSNPGSIAAWLRQGELAAASIRCQKWDSGVFRRQLTVIRGLTREKDPLVFMPQLTRLCAECGVAVVAMRAPKLCRASGATRFLSPMRPLLMLSFRYLSDDQLWFTFFHEAAHLILHGNQYLFLEGDDRLTTKEEEEANAFASDFLIPPDYQAALLGLSPSRVPIARFARHVGVSPGIVVGQLQFRGRIGFNSQLNKLKRRYTWQDD